MKEEKDNLTLQIHNKQLRLNKNESELKLGAEYEPLSLTLTLAILLCWRFSHVQTFTYIVK